VLPSRAAEDVNLNLTEYQSLIVEMPLMISQVAPVHQGKHLYGPVGQGINLAKGAQGIGETQALRE
jgi:hypothetical protein